jgi:YHS domain-containing protein
MRTTKKSRPASAAPDPALPMVCGRDVAGDPAYFPSAKYDGRTVHFCTETCLNAFRSDPDRFYTVHGKRMAGRRAPVEDGCDCGLKSGK